MHDAWEQYIEVSYNRALEECAGVLINELGREQGIDGYTLFTGNVLRARRYASWELLRYWEGHPRLTMHEFEEQWVAGTSNHWEEAA